MKSSYWRFISLGCIGALASSLLWLTWLSTQPVAAAPADVLTVCASCTHTTVAGALAAASAGDTIVISTTTHTEPGLTVNKSVIIQGLETVTTTWYLSGTPLAVEAEQEVYFDYLVVDAQMMSRAIVNYGQLNLSNIVVQHGNSPESEVGGGLFNYGTVYVHLTKIRQNNAFGGAGIYNAPAGVLHMSYTTVTHNIIFEDGEFGGGIFNQGTAVLENSMVQDNRSGDFAGIGAGLANTGDITLTNSTVWHNGFGNEGTTGGGLYNTVDGRAWLISSTIQNNHAGNASSGGMYNAGQLWITDTLFTQNSGRYNGGGLNNISSGQVWINNSTFSFNGSQESSGGAIFNGGQVTINNTQFIENKAYSWFNATGGGAIASSGQLTITNSSFVENYVSIESSSEGLGGAVTINAGFASIQNTLFKDNYLRFVGNEFMWAYGGALNVKSAATAEVVNSTFSGNYINQVTGEEIGSSGGAIFNSGQLSLAYTTIAENHSLFGGGLDQDDLGGLTIEGSIVAGNQEGDCLGNITSAGYNLFGDGTGCPETEPTDLVVNATNLFTTTLYPLADNGGETETYALRPGSLAFNHIPAGSAGCGTTVTTDQRGEPRPFGGLCDVGAFEGVEGSVTMQLSLIGPGSGSVLVEGEASCDEGVCSYQVVTPTVITLTAVADVGSVFAEWGGACTGTTGVCVLTITEATTITAGFDIASHVVTLTVADPEHGSVTNSQDGLPCSATCTYTVTHGSTITFTNQAEIGYVTSWSGVCSGMMPSCLLYVTSDMNITAHFQPASYPVTLTVDGPAGNGVSNSWDETTCLATCVYTIPHGLTMTFTAVVTSGSVFESWSTGCGTASSCAVTVTAPLALTAGFEAVLPPANYQQFLPLIVR